MKNRLRNCQRNRLNQANTNEIIISKWFGSCPNLEGPDEMGSDIQASVIEEEEGIFIIYGNFKDFYTEKKKLGQGMSAVVKLCVSCKTQESFAVKIVDTKGDEELEGMIKKEFKFRKNLSHKNIVSVHELYIDRAKGKIYTVMELAEGREMFDVIRSIGQYNEMIASNLFKQLILAIQFLHKNGVVHRDLKPHNIIVSPDGSVLKLTDFNVSKFWDKSTLKYSAMSKQNMKMWTYTGTVAFLAPEVLEDLEYTEAVDMWGAGIVLFMMLSGYHPFKSEEMDDIIEEIKLAKIEFKEDDWESISDDAKDLVKNLLEKDPNKRFSPFQALTHPWIIKQGNISSRSIHKTRENLDRYYDLKRELAEKNTPFTELIKRRELNKDGSPLKYFKLCKAYTGEIAGSLLYRDS